MKLTKMTMFCAAGAALMLATSAKASLNLIVDGDFSIPLQGVGGYTYAPTGSPWNFVAGSGITSLPSDWALGASAPSSGSQTAFLQGQGANFSQTVSAPAAGLYDLSFMDAGRPDFGSYGGDLTYEILINSTPVYIPLSTVSSAGGAYASSLNWTPISFDVFLGSGPNTVEFLGLTANNPYHRGDDSAFIDNVSLTAVPEPTTIISGVLMLLPFGASTLRILRRGRAA